MFKLAKSLIKENKGLTAALTILYILTVILIVASSMISNSVKASIESFEDECNVADCYILSAPIPSDRVEAIRDVSGVKAAYSSEFYDCMVRMPDGQVYLMDFIGIQDESLQNMFITGEDDNVRVVTHVGDGLSVNNRFARANGLEVGDMVEVHSPLGVKEVEVTSTVSAPETLIPMRDEYAWYEDGNYGFFFADEELYHELFGYAEYHNEWIVYLEDGADYDEVIEKVDDALGPEASAVMVKTWDSQQWQAIQGNLDSLDSVCVSLPNIILTVVILFSTLFIGQVIRRSRPLIGLLKALGHDHRRITRTFVIYVSIPMIAGLVLGTCIGIASTIAMLQLYLEELTLPSMVLSCDVARLLMRYGLVVVLTVASCLIATASISKVDPSEAYGGSKSISRRPSALTRKLPLGPFAKVAIELAMRNKLRILNSSLCIMAALCLVSAGVFLAHSISESMSFTFDQRLSYDAIVDIKECLDSHSDIVALDDVDKCESVIRGYSDVSMTAEDDNALAESETIQINAIEQDSELISLYDPEGNLFHVEERGIVIDEGLANRFEAEIGDKIFVDGTMLEITGIAREYVYPVSYISLEQADRPDMGDFNAIVMTLSEGVAMSDFRETILETAPCAYILPLEVQRDSNVASMTATLYPIWFVVILSVLIGLVIIYNMTELSIAERRREYATLLVLGVNNARISGIALLESAVELVLAIVVGLPIADFVGHICLESMCSVGMQYPVVSPSLDLLAAVVVTIAYAIIATLMASRRVNKWNAISVLNSED